MATTMHTKKAFVRPAGASFLERLWDESWTYIKTVVDVVREPVLILDKNLRVMTANESFYTTFQVGPNDTENKIVYELGDGQWNIPSLKKLLEDILPHNTFFKGFEVSHEFPHIGPKTILLNARQIHFQADPDSALVPPIILLAMEDVTEMVAVAETLAGHAKQLQEEFTGRIEKLETRIEEMQKEMYQLKTQNGK